MNARGPKHLQAAGRALDRFELYELAVTDAPRLVRFLRAVHGRNPRSLREDFSGSGALARAWVRQRPEARAVAVDCDPEPLRHAAGVPRLAAIVSDVLRCRARADVIAATNFPIGYWRTRPDLLAYLRHARRCLRPRGVFVADIYGGSHAFLAGVQEQKLRGPHGERIDYTWEQRTADPLTGLVLNAIHFRVTRRGRRRAAVHRDAFTYHWRLWSIPELRDAMFEAGFRSIEVHDRLGGALDDHGNLHVRPLHEGDPLDEDYVAYLVARP